MNKKLDPNDKQEQRKMERREYTLCNKDAIQNTNRVFDNVKPKIVPMSIYKHKQYSLMIRYVSF